MGDKMMVDGSGKFVRDISFHPPFSHFISFVLFFRYLVKRGAGKDILNNESLKRRFFVFVCDLFFNISFTISSLF